MEKKDDDIFGEEPEKKSNIWAKVKAKTEKNPVKENKPKVWDKEVAIKVKPWSLVKGFFVIAIIVAIFFLGRFSIDPPEFGVLGFAVHDTTTELTEETTPEVKDTEPVAEETPIEEETIPVEAPPEEEIVDEEPEKEEVIITKYSKVALSINSAATDWKGTWGKITGLHYTIKNNEDGTIKPEYVIMTVEGYGDAEKKASLPKTSFTIKKGEKHTGLITIPNGFAYNEKTAGNLESVEVKIYLYDENDHVVTMHKGEFNLKE